MVQDNPENRQSENSSIVELDSLSIQIKDVTPCVSCESFETVRIFDSPISSVPAYKPKFDFNLCLSCGSIYGGHPLVGVVIYKPRALFSLDPSGKKVFTVSSQLSNKLEEFKKKDPIAYQKLMIRNSFMEEQVKDIKKYPYRRKKKGN